MKYTKISTFAVVAIVATTLLAAGLITAIGTANEAEAQNTINSNNGQTGGSGGSGGQSGKWRKWCWQYCYKSTKNSV